MQPTLRFRSSILARQTAFVALLVTLTGGTLIFAGYRLSREMMRDQIDQRLLLAASDRQVLMQTYVLHQLERAALVASRTRLRQLVREHAASAIDPGTFRLESGRILADAQRSSSGFHYIAIADRRGVVVTATDETLLGRDYSADSDVQAGRWSAHLGLPGELEGAHQALLTAPLTADDGEFLGVVIVSLEVKPLVAFITDRTGLGESGEVLVGMLEDDHVRLLVRQRHAPHAQKMPLQSVPIMAQAFGGEAGFLRAKDYRGTDVLAAYRPVGYRDWRMVVKIDAAEAYAPLERLRVLLIGLVAGLLAAGVLASYLLTRRSVRPILDLADKAAAVAAGDLKVRVPVTSQDEIGKLAGAFNRMTEELDAKVEALRRNERQLALVYNHVSDVVFYLGVEPGDRFRFLSVNPEFSRATGVPADQVIGKLVQEVIPEPAHALVLSSYREAIRDKKTVQWEEVSVYPAGTKYGEVTVTPIFDGDGRCTNLVGTVHDVTERKQAEEQIRRLNADLEQRVIERTAQLEAANRELEAFSYSVSHDLRAPLRAVDGFSRILLEDHAPALPAEAQRYLHKVRGNTLQMSRLIDDLLTLARMSRQALHKQTVDPTEVARRALAGLPVPDGRQVEVQIAPMPACRADPVLLQQVYVNLLDNALKFTRGRERGEVEVGALEGDPSDAPAQYFVRDNGVGFDMRYAGKLFGVFQRLHTTDEFEGTGVGLAIVQNIVQRHGGRVWADAAVDQGATFYFTLAGLASDREGTQ